MGSTESCATDSDWKSGAGICFCSLHEESWIPAEFREAMDEAAQGKMVNMERVMAGEKPPGA
jgi:predicted transcriptional regulator